MAGALETVSKVKTLLHTTNMSVLALSMLLQSYGIEAVSESAITRAIGRSKFSSDETDAKIRKVVLQIEALIKFMQPFRVSLSDFQHMRTMLDILASCSVAVEIEPKGVGEHEENR